PVHILRPDRRQIVQPLHRRHRVRRPRPEDQVPPLDPPECLHRHGHRLPTRPSHDISRTTSCGVARVPWRWISLYWSPRPPGVAVTADSCAAVGVTASAPPTPAVTSSAAPATVRAAARPRRTVDSRPTSRPRPSISPIHANSRLGLLVLWAFFTVVSIFFAIRVMVC